MGNTIWLCDNCDEKIVESLSMSNTATSVLLEVLALSGSDLAVTDREKEFIVWLNQRDQSVVGIGTVGFSISEMPWTKRDFYEEKIFLLSVIDGAINKHRWEDLNYIPNEDIVVRNLNHLRLLITNFKEELVDESHYLYWSTTDELDEEPTISIGFPQCVKHKVILSCHGCLFCNNGM
ncbi:hypothetical protein HQN90_37075 [Paenibacillus alba]|uniref:hypothetical protein n=1 Tax=Paenibacillus alba TaxID=1197127 RepID=UPI001564B554|nr:hypothetical protein [Paenibacillus alba]NQX71703.1 hypothetical protein [Paenibacillus alba]